jgi:hypothetical protein
MSGFPLRCLGSALVASLAIGCGSNDAPPPPPPPDCDEPGCIPHPGGGGPAGGGTKPPDGGVDRDAVTPPEDAVDGGTVSIAYTVKQTIDSWFYAAASFEGDVRVAARSASGQLTSLGDAGAPSPGVLADVGLGANWFLVEDATLTRRLKSTLQLVDINDQSRFADLRAIANDDLMNLVVDQVVWTPPAGTATIILNFRRAGRAVAGVTVNRSALSAGTTVAYDSSGMYVSDAMVLGIMPATDVQGTAIVREIAGTQPFPALTSATLRYTLAGTTATFPALDVKIARDAVTWVQVDVP